MNYLAHIVLSEGDHRVGVGNFMGDAVKGSAYLNYPLRIREGIILHRRIDYYTDNHVLVKETIAELRQSFGRYSGILLDMYFDHFLAKDIEKYTGTSLRCFTLRFYLELLKNYRNLPQRIRGFLWHFILTDRLYRYRTLKGLHRSLEIMALYKNLRIVPDEAIVYLQDHYEELHDVFECFFPELQRFSRNEYCRINGDIGK